jgi:UDP-glucose 4-epimerase
MAASAMADAQRRQDLAHYLVTGGAGFIGSHLADALLAEGHRVRVLDDLSTGRAGNLDPRCELVRGCVTSPETVAGAMQGVSGCYHLAAIASVARGNEDWRGTHLVNQTGTVTVLDAARAAGRIPVVYASSAAVYGNLGDAVAREDLLPAPLTAYGADKLGSELHGAVAWQVHGVPTVGMRFFNVFGPRQDPHSPYSGVISIFAALAAADRPITVHGDGRQERDFVYVGDVVAHLRAAMGHIAARPGRTVLNVCTGRATSVLDLAHVLGRLHGRLPRIAHGPARAGDIRRSLGDPARAIATLGVRAGVALEEGLARTLASLEAAAA